MVDVQAAHPQISYAANSDAEASSIHESCTCRATSNYASFGRFGSSARTRTLHTFRFVPYPFLDVLSTLACTIRPRLQRPVPSPGSRTRLLPSLFDGSFGFLTRNASFDRALHLRSTWKWSDTNFPVARFGLGPCRFASSSHHRPWRNP